MQASILEYHRTCSLHNSPDCHVHPNQITVVFVIHRKKGHLRSLTGTMVGPLDEVTGVCEVDTTQDMYTFTIHTSTCLL